MVRAASGSRRFSSFVSANRNLFTRLCAKHGQNSPRWAQRRDMALYYENRRKALNVTPNGASITLTEVGPLTQ
jgi:hypothetical protein